MNISRKFQQTDGNPKSQMAIEDIKRIALEMKSSLVRLITKFDTAKERIHEFELEITQIKTQREKSENPANKMHTNKQKNRTEHSKTVTIQTVQHMCNWSLRMKRKR